MSKFPTCPSISEVEALESTELEKLMHHPEIMDTPAVTDPIESVNNSISLEQVLCGV